MLKLTNKNSGFTLIELMVVIAIIAILAGLSVVSYVIIANRSTDSKLLAVATQIETGITQRRSATFNVVPDRGTTTRADFMKQYQIDDIDSDVNVRYERSGCNSAISDSCTVNDLSKDKVNFYVTEEATGAGEAGEGVARVIYWSSENKQFIMTSTSYNDEGEVTIDESQLPEGSTWSSAY